MVDSSKYLDTIDELLDDLHNLVSTCNIKKEGKFAKIPNDLVLVSTKISNLMFLIVTNKFNTLEKNISRIRKYIRKYPHPYLVKLDIENFYLSIPYELALGVIAHKYVYPISKILNIDFNSLINRYSRLLRIVNLIPGFPHVSYIANAVSLYLQRAIENKLHANNYYYPVSMYIDDIAVVTESMVDADNVYNDISSILNHYKFNVSTDKSTIYDLYKEAPIYLGARILINTNTGFRDVILPSKVKRKLINSLSGNNINKKNGYIGFAKQIYTKGYIDQILNRKNYVVVDVKQNLTEV